MGMREELLGNVGPPHLIEHDGVTYHCRLIDQHVQAAFAKALLARAKTAAGELRELMNATEWLAYLRGLNEEYLRGEFALLSPRGLAVLGGTDGQLLLASLLFEVPALDLLGLFAGRGPEVAELMRTVFRESFPHVDWDRMAQPGQEEGNGQRPRQSVGAT